MKGELFPVFLVALFILATPVGAQQPGDVDPLNLNIVGTVVNATAVQPDGKVIIGGKFTSVLGSPRNNIARINADGTLDTSFDLNTDGTVNAVAVQADGKVLLGGFFATLQPNGAPSPITRNYFARLYNDPATQTLSAPSTSLVLWQRGGSSPAVSQVTFELSIDGGANWSSFGAASRIGTTANWRLTGLALPASGSIRARGVTNSGYNNASSGLVEAIMVAQPGQPIEAWRKSYFGPGATNSGDAADTADPDQDGLNNLDEYARYQHPLFATNSPAPIFNAPTFTFTRNIAASDISFRVEVTDTLPPAWIPLATRPAGAAEWTTEPGVSAVENDAGVVTITDSVAPGAVPQRFLRVVVTRL
jgi:hypothetical protein